MSIALKQLAQEGAVDGKSVVWNNALGLWLPSDPLLFSDIAAAVDDDTTISATDVLVDSMTLTPGAGTYLVWFSGSIEHSANNEDITGSIYVGGVLDTDSERLWHRGGAQAAIVTSHISPGKVVVNGSQAIEGRWRTTDATATMHQRSLIILKTENA